MWSMVKTGTMKSKASGIQATSLPNISPASECYPILTLHQMEPFFSARAVEKANATVHTLPISDKHP